MPPLVTLTIDTEEEWDWHSGWPVSGYGVRNIEALPRFQALCDQIALAPTYFANYAVLHDPQARTIIQDVAARPNVEIGMHIHPWNTPPIVNKGPVRPRQTFLHQASPELIRAKLATVYDEFAGAGLRPTSFRGGRYSTGPVIQGFLREKAFLADASAVPFTTFEDDGAPNYRSRTIEPRRLLDDSPQAQPLWEVPLTRGFTRRPFVFWQWCYDRVEFSSLRKLRLIGIAEKLGLVRKVWLNFEQHSASELLGFLKTLRKLDLPYICFTFHSSSLRAGMSPYTGTLEDEERFWSKLETVLRRLPEMGFQPATVSAVARHLESNYARTRNQSAR